MNNRYPYQNTFELYLKKHHLAQITIDEYNNTLADLFNYLSNFNQGYQRDHRVSQIFDRDVQDYMAMLIKKRNLNNSTYNKVLSHINIYFKYLFANQLTNKLPTLTLKGRDRNKIKRIQTRWLKNLPTLILDPNLHPYTKMTLLLISIGYSVKEFLLPNFYREFQQIKWTHDYQLKFLNHFNHFIKPIQKKQACPDIFLKQRFSNDPHLTLPGLHKYLRPDEKYLGISLSPSVLFQSYIINFIIKHPALSSKQLSIQLKLSLSSVIYYQAVASRIQAQ